MYKITTGFRCEGPDNTWYFRGLEHAKLKSKEHIQLTNAAALQEYFEASYWVVDKGDVNQTFARFRPGLPRKWVNVTNDPSQNTRKAIERWLLLDVDPYDHGEYREYLNIQELVLED